MREGRCAIPRCYNQADMERFFFRESVVENVKTDMSRPDLFYFYVRVLKLMAILGNVRTWRRNCVC